ncbi:MULTISPECIES: hypothetical protein [Streptomyces]|uniref:hypothetical protein n=1 Tax=Streptomyces TaxID=1883 RepID=UPI001E2B8E5D|nr:MULTISPECIES: hypothetical protein [Streptomyces]UFQ19177.1 hypothetical protein J2N69_31700 [Streptomyces huasconensis]WCL88797.1 hypothetical protein PPN52_31665 [Streptomyces sp. JCM 35825]
MTHISESRPRHADLPRPSRPRPRAQEPRTLPPMLPGTDEPPAPASVRAAFALWLTAVAAGVFETVLALIGAAADGDASLGDLSGGLALRVAVYSAVVLVAVRMRRGGNGARLALAGVLGVLGTLSLLIEPVQWLADGHSLGAAFRGLGAVDVMFGASRALHVAAVLAAVALMFRPSANAWFRAARRTR